MRKVWQVIFIDSNGKICHLVEVDNVKNYNEAFSIANQALIKQSIPTFDYVCFFRYVYKPVLEVDI